MKVSARNVFKGQVSQVQEGAVNAEVVLTLPGGEQLVAVVTMESIRNLGIAVGKEAVALIKAPWVMLMTESSDIRLSARNCLEGKVLSVNDGAVNAEVVIELVGGSKVYSIVTRDAVAELGLVPGVSATAVIKLPTSFWVFRPDTSQAPMSVACGPISHGPQGWSVLKTMSRQSAFEASESLSNTARPSASTSRHRPRLVPARMTSPVVS